MTRIALLASSNGAVTETDPARALAQCGGNTGNLLFHHATAQILGGDFVRFDWNSDPGEVRERSDVLVIPEANAANPERAYGDRATFLRRVDRPLVVFGLGAQGPHIGARLDLQRGTIDYLRELSERTEHIGVRGEYSGEVLAAVGVHNTLVAGCPANVITPGELRPSLEAAMAGSLRRIQVGGGDMKRVLRRVEHRLVRWLRASEGRYVCQSGALAMLSAGADVDASARRKASRHLGAARRGSAVRADMANWGAIHFDAAGWIAASKTAEISISSRIHGTIAALQAGVPAVLVRHDSRTEELSRTLAIPSLSPRELLTASSPRAAIELSQPDWAAYEQRRVELRSVLVGLFAAGGIEWAKEPVCR